ncbi:MAG: hypothetical protein RLZZ292_3838 [Bacteroidota bacterium]|jgi:CRISPR/Cas system endoribonuclease Cas6 (RAMP superfamily)
MIQASEIEEPKMLEFSKFDEETQRAVKEGIENYHAKNWAYFAPSDEVKQMFAEMLKEEEKAEQ